MAYEYLSARVTLQKYMEEINNNISFFINFGGDLGKAFSLTKKMGYELHLISWALCQGENKSAIAVCVCVLASERRSMHFWITVSAVLACWTVCIQRMIWYQQDLCVQYTSLQRQLLFCYAHKFNF